ncbi:MAG: PEGA domain-containing protein [Polyangiaceae bacterium]|nr:PEGA domain-containing protein [Polyangiaceae bacterium]
MRFSRVAWRLIVLAAVALALASSRGTFAQPAGGAPAGAASAAPADPAAGELERRKEEAKQRFLRGTELAANEEWDAALAEFLASRELFPTRVALKNAALMLRQLKRYAESMEMYRELLARFGEGLDAAERKVVDDAVVQLQTFVGELAVESDQRDATVVVDGQDRGTTPLAAPLAVNAGTHSVRVLKEGFIGHEEQVLVAGGQKKVVRAKLRPLARSGRLVVKEATGKALEVVVDGAVVGKTPWTGTLSVGTHTVFLTGPNDEGTPPSAATVSENHTSTLTLRATVLDAKLRIEPTPSNARIDVDGVQIGNGVWEGGLKSGSHKIEVSAPGFLAYRKDVRIQAGQREVLRVVLERDLSDPRWKDRAFQPHLFAEAVVGGAWGPTLGGAAGAACGRGECSEHAQPTGFLAGARGGYQISTGLAAEVFLGWLRLQESMTRTVVADGESTRTYLSEDYEDSTTVQGPMLGLSASYQFFETTPLLFRVWAGASRVSAATENSGTYQGEMVRTGGARAEVVRFQQGISIPEETQQVWMPLVAPEVRFGYRFGKRFALDLGVGFFAFFPGDALRRGRTSLSNDEGERVDAFGVAGTFLDGEPVRPGTLQLPREKALGTFFAIVPSLGGRFDF